MKFKRIIAAAASMAIAVSALDIVPSGREQNVHAAETVTVSPFNKYEINDGVFEGWGTALCWWANRVGYSDSLAEQTAQAFFGEDGLRMNIARYNIGGGDDPSHDHITRTDSNMPGYTTYNNGQVTYNWNADANQRNVLMRALKAGGDDMIVEMFSNSPPYYMTQSGCTGGNTDGGKNNLKDDCYDDFAEYLATVCEHYQNEWGVDVESVSPINEPYTNFWYAGSPKQEGCHYDQGNSESTIMVELSKALQKHGLNSAKVVGMDETSIDTTISSFNALSNEAKSVLGRIDTHTYSGSKRGELKALAVKNNRNLWMSEVDGGATAGSNAGQMGAALWLADRITVDLNGMNPSAWVLWQAIDKHICAAGYNGKKDSGMPDINGGFWGLAVADHDNSKIILTKKYYAFGQFSRYIRPGFTMLNVSGRNVAAYDGKNDRLVIVSTNTSGSANDVYFDLSQFDTIGSSVKVIRTSGDVTSGENWKELSPISTNGGGFSASLLANSVTTFIIDGVKSPTADLTEIKPVSSSGSQSWQNNSSTDYTKALDGDLSTYFDGLGNGYVQLDLGGEYELTAVGVAPRSGYEYRCLEASVFTSTDGVSWSEAYKIGNVPADCLNYYTKLSANQKVRYVRYQTPSGAPTDSRNKDNSCCCNIAEFKVYGKPSGVGESIPLDSSMISGSAPWHDSSDDCTKTIDGKLDTYFDGVGNGWVQVDLKKLYSVDAVGFAPRIKYEYRCVDAVISVSADGVSWKDVYTVGSLPASQLNIITLDEPQNVRYIRYQVPEGAPTNPYNKDNVYCCNLSEIAVYGSEAEQSAGDMNADGVTDIADAVLLQSWLLGEGPTVADWQSGDLNANGRLDIFDLALMRKQLLAA